MRILGEKERTTKWMANFIYQIIICKLTEASSATANREDNKAFIIVNNIIILVSCGCSFREEWDVVRHIYRRLSFVVKSCPSLRRQR
jgi:hypothetical protein